MEAVAEHNKNNKLDALVMHHTATTTENVREKSRTNEIVSIAAAEMNLSIPKIPPVVPVTVKIPAGAAPKSKQKQTKKKKDKNVPQRNKYAYHYFKPEMSSKLKQDGQQVNEIILGQCWKVLSAEEKEPYNALALEDKERYKTERVAYDQKKAADLNVPPNPAGLMEGPGGVDLGGKGVVTEGRNDCVGGVEVHEWGGGKLGNQC